VNVATLTRIRDRAHRERRDRRRWTQRPRLATRAVWPARMTEAIPTKKRNGLPP